MIICQKNGAVLIFDETITGFRFSKGGAQEVFKVTPDLSTFGKGIANGFPLSAIVGKKEIMLEMENVFLSGTFGGELLSLAAAKYVLNKHMREDICADLARKGNLLASKVEDLIKQYELNEIVKGDSIFCATGITSSEVLSGIHIQGNRYNSETLVTHKNTNFREILKRSNILEE